MQKYLFNNITYPYISIKIKYLGCDEGCKICSEYGTCDTCKD